MTVGFHPNICPKIVNTQKPEIGTLNAEWQKQPGER
jgi:hypothetical protein